MDCQQMTISRTPRDEVIGNLPYKYLLIFSIDRRVATRASCMQHSNAKSSYGLINPITRQYPCTNSLVVSCIFPVP